MLQPHLETPRQPQGERLSAAPHPVLRVGAKAVAALERKPQGEESNVRMALETLNSLAF